LPLSCSAYCFIYRQKTMIFDFNIQLVNIFRQNFTVPEFKLDAIISWIGVTMIESTCRDFMRYTIWKSGTDKHPSSLFFIEIFAVFAYPTRKMNCQPFPLRHFLSSLLLNILITYFDYYSCSRVRLQDMSGHSCKRYFEGKLRRTSEQMLGKRQASSRTPATYCRIDSGRFLLGRLLLRRRCSFGFYCRF
jgi:hypothetical protein